MKRSTLFWVFALVLTAVTALYQRLTGPSYPQRGSVSFESSQIDYVFERSHGGASDAVVNLNLPRPDVRATLRWKRFKTNDDWTETPMAGSGSAVTAQLPYQPPGGKLAYEVRLRSKEADLFIPAEPVVIRFKGEVPLWIVIPHILAMFGAMLLSTKAGLEYFLPIPSYARLLPWTIGFLAAGGFIFGPLMQFYAFDAFWTGWPVGTDLTDNKTAVALLGWIAAAVAQNRSAHPGRWILAVAALMLFVYMIPHSILGSELDYSTLPK